MFDGGPQGHDRPWIKICGLRDPESASRVVELRPEAIGLNFFSRSSRFVADDAAREIAATLPPEVLAIGVFVNEPLPEVVRRVATIPLSAVQFHGDESPEYVAEFCCRCPNTPVIRAFRRGSGGLSPLVPWLNASVARGAKIGTVLIDADAGSAYGGTGITLPWSELRNELDDWTGPPVILAGGLRPENVADAISAVRPNGVDVASGVESSPGVKDLERVARFIQAARGVAG